MDMTCILPLERLNWESLQNARNKLGKSWKGDHYGPFYLELSLCLI